MTKFLNGAALALGLLAGLITRFLSRCYSRAAWCPDFGWSHVGHKCGQWIVE